MKIVPASTSSSPASMRNAVDLPDPDGPTSTISSPSPTRSSSESMAGASVPGYVRDADSKWISAIARAPDRRHRFPGGRAQLAPQPLVRPRARPDLVEPEQGRADHRVVDDHARADRGSDVRQPGVDRRAQVRAGGPHQPA